MRQLSFVIAAVIVVLISACARGPEGGMNSLNTARASLDPNLVRVRWFPVSGASGYKIYVPGSDTPTVVPASACMAASQSYRSGTCAHEMRITGGARSGVKITAFNVHGESQPVMAHIGNGE